MAFADAPDYRTYRLYNHFLSYNGKNAACTAKLGKLMEAIMKPYKYGDFDMVTILLYLEHLSDIVTWTEYLKA